ncbi:MULTISPECIES: LPS export ABC transporter periplasmic protein LptC [Sphingobium]|uniref:LPS export ABC transporter periplasmic protein LptC n=1 Tax=Sphingobium TaxID=165695 RepID=UPI000DBB3C3A|nr:MULTISPECIES: LPS export ABC transporter periplasmic protein LptC [Sphingobium]KAA9019347.1 LPS export ABC transporter periplasmic protein LptC [Sphingobium limneticum]MBU0933089.1 LPS export ABC transporter periplasmic protein LptC [Alphaproteobacteria bacterium]BBD01759.1 lipopolysaccharide export system protein LptC [Sphingobium sp. YG1]
MSVQADQQRDVRRHWARPGGTHDRLVGLLKNWLPVAVGVLAALLATAPFTGGDKVSFVLDKNKVEVAKDRMRLTEALYRGEDSKGQPFSLRAGSAVQKSSREPIVDLNTLSARILLTDGPAMLTAQKGRYDMETERVGIQGPVQFEASGGYRLTTRDVGVDLKTRRMKSAGRVDGRIPIGTFSGDHLEADMNARTVTLNGRASLRIEQNGLKGRN